MKPFSYFGLFFLFLIIFISGCDKEDTTEISPFSDLHEEVNSIASSYLETGMVIGIIDAHQEKHIFTYGTKRLGTNEAPDEYTVFDIGSTTKTFTAIMLADLYLNGYLEDEIVAHYLPEEQVTLPNWNGEEITLIQVATHTSGLPRTPHIDGSAFPRPEGFDSENPYKAYTTEDVYYYLTDYCELEFEPGTWWGYSNTGYGLLGHIIGLINGTSYEQELTTRIFNELGMPGSSLFLNENQLNNMSTPYNPAFEEVPYYEANDIFQGAGFIKSNMRDMMTYLEANLGLINTSLREAMDLTYEPHMHQGSMGEQCLAWYIQDLDDGQQIIYSGGDTNGHSAFLGFNRSTNTGAVILSNYAMHGSQLTMGNKVMKAILKY